MGVFFRKSIGLRQKTDPWPAAMESLRGDGQLRSCLNSSAERSGASTGSTQIHMIVKFESDQTMIEKILDRKDGVVPGS
jgi:hypothetical protein